MRLNNKEAATSFFLFLLTGIYFWGLRPAGGFVDQSGVALTSGGGTLVLGTHDNVRMISA